ncbi:MAG: hypothetical protein J0M36_09340 [Caulobacterales bacterium]|nr:hypothetical protein [Caulobacterales bacterium]
MKKIVVVPLMVLALGACGSKDEAPPAANGESGADAASAEASGAGTAAAERLDCRAINARPKTGVDVAGVTLGMAVDDAFKAVACSDPRLVVEMTAPRSDGYRSIVGEREGEQFSVRLMGVSGQEQVVEVNRILQYEPGQEPAFDAVLRQLGGKYGTLVRTDYGGAPRETHKSVRRLDGASVTSLEDPLARGCPYDLKDQCGLTVTVNVDRAEANPALTKTLQVIMLDPRVTQRQTEIASRSSQDATQRRQAQEVQDAAGRAPKL